MSFEIEMPESMDTGGAFLQEPGTYHLSVLNVDEAPTSSKGELIDGFRVEVDVLAGPQAKKQAEITFFNPKLTDKNGGEMAKKKQARFAMATGILPTAKPGEKVTVDLQHAKARQLIVTFSKRKAQNSDKEFIDRFRFGLNYVSDGPRTGSPHEGHDGIGEAFAFGWNGGSDRYMNIFKGGTVGDGDSPGKLKVWDRIEAVLRFMCNGLDGQTGATTNGYKPVFEGGIKVDEAANQPTYYAGVSTTAHTPGTSWAVVGGLFGTGGGWEFSGVWPVRLSIMFLLHTDFVSAGGGASDVIVKMRLTKSTDSGATWNYVSDTEFNVAYVVDGAGKEFKFVNYSVVVPPGAAYRLRPEMIRDAVGGGDSLTCEFTPNYSTFALNEIR